MSASQLFVRAADAGDTYLYWRWADGGQPHFARIPQSGLDAVHAELGQALLTPIGAETPDAAADRALCRGAYADPERERALAARLTEVVFPAPLRAQLAGRITSGNAVRVRLTPSPRLAQIPWETLVLDDGRRLVEVADLLYDPPATLYAQRDRDPAPRWHAVAGKPPLHAVDPRLPARVVRTQGLRQVLDAAQRTRFRELTHPDAPDRVGVEYDRYQLHDDLVSQRFSRLFYLGHVSALPDEPGSASLHLSDCADTWGIANTFGVDQVSAHRRDHRPLCALDLLLGTTTASDVERLGWRRAGVNDARTGAQLWPMPHRVALIACEGGADYRSAETFGLVLAMLNAGAELVTTTRWTLPANAAFAHGEAPTSRLAEAVDAAHGGDDPVAAVAEWQRGELAAWTSRGGVAHSPILWASLCHTFAPAGGYTGS